MPEKTKIMNNNSSIEGTLENRTITNKRKLEGEHFTGVIKRLNLDSGTKQTDPDLGLSHENQDN